MALAGGLPSPEPPLPDEEEEPPLPPCGATPQELREHPGLARLLRGLGRALGPDGLSAALQSQLRQAEAGLALRRGAWLRWETLWRALAELRRDPRPLPPADLRALERALALAELRRRDPSPAAAAAPPPPDAAAALGARLLAPLERRLAEKTRELAAYHAPPPEATPTGHALGVAEALAAERRRLRRGRGRRRRLDRALRRQRCAYPEVLARCAAILSALAGERRAGAGAELERRRGEYLEAKGAAVLLKIRLEELTLLLDAYPPEKVEAHRRIRAGLEEAARRAAGERGRARAALEAYGGLGPEFGALAAEYGALRRRLRHRRWALRQLRPPGDVAEDAVTSP